MLSAALSEALWVDGLLSDEHETIPFHERNGLLFWPDLFQQCTVSFCQPWYLFEKLRADLSLNGGLQETLSGNIGARIESISPRV